MKMLALDTSSAACSVAFVDNEQHILKHEILPQQHAQVILAWITEVLPCALNDVEVLAWGCGPGSFTGLRIAAAIMQALMFTYNLPLVNVSSLAAIAQAVYNVYLCPKIIIAVDAGMNEVYWGKYHANHHGTLELLVQEGRMKIGELLKLPLEHDCYVVGKVWDQYNWGEEQPRYVADSNCYPNALIVAQLAKKQYDAGKWHNKINVTPNYLRDNLFSGT